jgi:hypothetical protein
MMRKIAQKIDVKFLAIAGAILAIAFIAAWITIFLFRHFFPDIAIHTFWDELSGPTVATLVVFGIRSLLYRERIFHLMVTMDVPDLRVAHLWVPRRRRGWGMVFVPNLQREALIQDRDTLIRNIFWWGVYGVDRCTVCITFGDSDTGCCYLMLPRAPHQSHATIRVRLSELLELQSFMVSPHHIE